MTKPDGIVDIQPTQIATFRAAQYDPMFGEDSLLAIMWMAQQYGWTIHGTTTTSRGHALVVKSKSRKRYTVTSGEWIIALGAGGSLRVVSDKQYRQDYREVSA